MRTLALLVVIPLVALQTAPAAGKGGVEAGAARACENAVRRQMRDQHPNSGQVEVFANSLRQRQTKQNQIGIHGAGQVETRDSGRRKFSFDCVVQPNGNQVSSVRLEVESLSRFGGHTSRTTPSAVCKRAVAARIHRDHPASGKIRWLVASMKEQAAGSHTTIVTGRGRIQTRDGTWRKFSFRCDYDARTGKASNVRAKF
jgi:hypothetical protein